MTTETMNNELTFDQLDNVNGGIYAYAVAVKELFYDALTEIADAMDEANSSAGVVARGDGTDDTGFNPNNPFGKSNNPFG